MSTEQNTQQHIIRNTVVVAMAFGLAAGAGLVRNIVIAQQFGIGADLDAYYVAFKLPDLLFTIVAGGALATAFIPVFAEYLANDDIPGGWRLASAITNLVILVVGSLAIIAGIFAPWLVKTVLAPGFSATQQAETATIMRIVLVSTVLFGISGVQNSVLHGFKHFLLPALAPVVYPLGVIVGAIWLVPIWGVRGLAIGAVFGAALHLAIKVPGLIYFGFQWWPTLDLKRKTVQRVLVLMGPRVLDLGVFHLTLLVTTNLASRLEPGKISALEWGWDAMQLPETIIGTAFGLVAFPTLASLAAKGDLQGLQRTLGETLQAVLALTIPATFGLILLGRPLLALLYQRGAFDEAATEVVYIALQFYALGLVGHACLELAARAFFAQQDTITPLFIAIGSAVVNILLAIFLMDFMGHGGLALANSIAISAEVLVLLFILRRRLGGIEGRETLQALGKMVLAAMLMSFVVWGFVNWGEARELSVFWLVTLGSGLGFAVYVGSGLFLGIEALSYLPKALIGKEAK